MDVTESWKDDATNKMIISGYPTHSTHSESATLSNILRILCEVLSGWNIWLVSVSICLILKGLSAKTVFQIVGYQL